MNRLSWRFVLRTGLFLFLALREIGGRNLPNDLADLAADRIVGLTTVATVFGARVSAVATASIAGATLIALGLLGASRSWSRSCRWD